MKKLSKFFVGFVAILALIAPSIAQGKSVTVSWPQEPDNLNPMYSTMTFAGYTTQLFLAGAWVFDGDGNPVPQLVSEIPSLENGGLSEDGKTVTLKLKEGLVWSDGDALDSADFLFTAEMKLAESNAVITRSPYDQAANIEAPDATTVVLTFNEPYAPWLGLFSYVLPEHVLRPVFEADGTLDEAAFNRAPSVSSGAYVFQEWNVGNFMTFTANTSYAGGTPKINRLVVTFIPDEQTYKTALLNGDAQVGTFLPFSDVPELRAAGLEVQVIASGYNEGMYFNVGDGSHPAMKDVRVRKALALGFDRFGVVDDLLSGGTFAAASFNENTPYASPNLDPVPYDPTRAAELLDEAGWVDSDGDGIRDKEGEKLTIRFVTNTRAIRRDIQALAQQQWGQIGVEVVLENYPSDQFFASFANGGPIANGNYDVAEWSASPANFPDPDTTRFECNSIPSAENPTGGNWTYYCNEELSRLMVEQRFTTDFAARVALWHQIDEIIYNDYIWVGVWYDADVWIVGNGLVTGTLNGSTPFYNVVEWDVQ